MIDPNKPINMTLTKAGGGRMTQEDRGSDATGALVQKVEFSQDLTGATVTMYCRTVTLDLSDVEAEIRAALGDPVALDGRPPLAALLKTVVIEATGRGERLVVNGIEIPYRDQK